MTTLKNYKDGKAGCFANIRMDNGDPCFISVAQTGVLVKKSKLGMRGPKLYESRDAYHAAKTGQALAALYPDSHTPDGMTNPILNAFTNAVLHCSTLAEATRVIDV